MATLGEIIAQLDSGEHLAQVLAQIGNAALIEKLEAKAAAVGQEPVRIAGEAVRAFANGADDDAWLKLLGKLNDTPLPAAACLKEMLSWALKE